MTLSSQRLTKYPLASLREIGSLAFSFMLIFLSGSLMGLCDRIILAHSSLYALEASVSTIFLVQLFQISTIRLVSVAQTYVAQYKGANQNSQIGAIIWQMIWLSLILMLIILPISYPLSHFYFKDSPIQKDGLAYFYYLIHGNFLFTIGAALSCFYLGQGKSKKVIIATLFSQIINLLLDFLFVFGIDGWIAPMGAKGAALATAIAEFFVCVILFCDFLKEKYRRTFGTGDFYLKKSLLFQTLKFGISQSYVRFMPVLYMIAANYIILQKTEPEYLSVYTFGCSIVLFIVSLYEGFRRSITTIGGYIIGAKKPLIWQLMRSSFLFITIFSISLSIPSLFFRDSLIDLFFKEKPSPFLINELYLSLYWMCLSFFTLGISAIGHGIINAYGDPKFQLIFGSVFALFSFLIPVYLTIYLGNMRPHVFWIILGCHCIPGILAFFFRFKQEKWKTSTIISQAPIIESSPISE